MTNHRVVRCANPTSGRVSLMALSVAFWLALSHGAHSLDTCKGTYSGSAIHPLQSPNVVLFRAETNEQPTPLGNGFVAGLQRAGVVTSGKPTTRLNIASIVIPAQVGSGQPQRYHGVGWAEDTSTSAESVVSSTLQLSLVLTDIKTADIIWVASLSCQVLTNDKGRVVETIGELLGRALGKDTGTIRF
jgi:hypothetical protein